MEKPRLRRNLTLRRKQSQPESQASDTNALAIHHFVTNTRVCCMNNSGVFSVGELRNGAAAGKDFSEEH